MRHLFAVLFIAAFLIACGGDDNDPGNASSRYSGCGGFGTTAYDLLAAVENCDEELVWSYDAAIKELTLTHRNTYFNCVFDDAGHIDVTVSEGTGTYTVLERGVSDMWAACVCRYDIETKITDVVSGKITVTIKTSEEYMEEEGHGPEVAWTGSLDLTQESGTVLIFENPNCL